MTSDSFKGNNSVYPDLEGGQFLYFFQLFRCAGKTMKYALKSFRSDFMYAFQNFRICVAGMDGYGQVQIDAPTQLFLENDLLLL